MTLSPGVQIIEKAKEIGATMAGIADIELIKKSPSHEIIKKLGMKIDGINPYKEICDFDGINWPVNAKSVVVIALSHPQDKPELDWWSKLKGTHGNNELIRINRELSKWIEEKLKIKTHKLPYFIETGGIFLKDSAVLAGIGCIGKNNMLVTPEFGPRVRLRSLLLEKYLTPKGPIDFDPCDGCQEVCRKVCPQQAYEKIVSSTAETGMAVLPGRDGFFSRAKCMIQMDTDSESAGLDRHETMKSAVDIESTEKAEHCDKSCRLCEFACPVGY